MNRKTHATAAVLAVVGVGAVGVGLSGFAEADGRFPIWQVLFDLGKVLVIISVVMAVGLIAVRRTHTQDEAFDAGFRAGYRQGRRPAGLKVVPFRRENRDDEQAI